MTFDGQSKVAFSLTNNTNQSSGILQTWPGTYSLQANCTGTLTLTSGDTASFSLESYNTGKDYLITGEDGTYTFTGSGSVLPASPCSASQLSGSYSFNGSGYGVTSGAISGANNISGLLQFDGKSAVTANSFTITMNATGQYSVAPSCFGSATVTDSAGNVSTLQFIVTASSGSNFLITGTSPFGIFTGSGRTESTTAPCSVATLTGVRSLVMTGRSVSSAGMLTGACQGVGAANFDGAGKVVLSLATDTSLSLGVPETLSGTYTLGSDCAGAVDITSGDVAAFILIPYNQGKSFTITGSDLT